MTGVRISALPPIPSAPALTDLMPEVQPASSGTTYKITLQQLLTLFQPSIVLTNAGNPNTLVAGTQYQFLWDTSNNFLWVCTTTGNAASAVWTQVDFYPTTNGQLIIGSTGSPPVRATLTSGTNISITNGAGSITIASTGMASFTWNNVTTASATLAANNGYIVNNNTGPVVLTLPATISQGSVIEVVGGTSGSATCWQIAQLTGQLIHFGTSTTTSGTSGYLQATAQYNAIRLICITANTTFAVLSSQGNITVN